MHLCVCVRACVRVLVCVYLSSVSKTENQDMQQCIIRGEVFFGCVTPETLKQVVVVFGLALSINRRHNDRSAPCLYINVNR